MKLILKKILNKLFYNPYRASKKYQNISIDKSTYLLKSTSFRFDAKDFRNNAIFIDANSMIGCNFIFESNQGKISIGQNSFINSGTNLICREGIEIGNHVTIAWGCTIYDHNSHSLNYEQRRYDYFKQIQAYQQGMPFSHDKNWDSVSAKKIVIEDDVWIGFDCLILKGVTIGKGAIIGAKSVIREDVEPWTVVAGNPAVLIKHLNHD